VLFHFPILLVFMCCPRCRAQVATGRPQFGTFGGGPDVVNLANLNSNLTIPVRNKAGRGTNFTYDLVYDSSIWQPSAVGGTVHWQPQGQWGWRGLQPAGESYVTYAVTYISGACGQGGDSSYQEWAYSGFQYFDVFGVAHTFGITGQYYNSPGGNSCPPNGPEPPSQDEPVSASDTSGDTMYVTMESGGSVSGYLIDKNGTLINAVFSLTPPTTGATSTTDRNGNVISQVNGVYTDTLGTTPLSVTGSAPSNTNLSYIAPSGATASYIVGYTGYIVRTAFGCSGIAEYNSGTTEIYLVTSITLPDTTTYEFTYEQTPGYSSDRTGRIKSVKLPTGGTITYAYSGGSSGYITCADGSAATLTRTTPDGTWTYAHSESGTAWTTTVTDPQSNKTTLNFQGIYETEREVYEGSATLLKTTFTCYNGDSPNCNSTAFNLPIIWRTHYVQWPGGLESETNTTYNSSGLVTETDEYAYGSGSPGSIVRKTLTTYASLGNGIVSMPSSITVEDGSGNIGAEVSYAYDSGSVIATSGTPQHVSITGSRGNATTINSFYETGRALVRNYTYYDTGNVSVATDVNSAQTTYTYGSGSCGNSFPTSVAEPLSLSRSMTWNCTGGVGTSLIDENGNTSSFGYVDPYFWRPNSATDQIANITDLTYNNQTSAEAALLFNSRNSTTDVLATVDSLGRRHVSQVKQSPSSSTYDSVETDYDSLGRPDRTTLSYAGTAGQTSSSAPGTSTSYDALSRITQVTDSSGKDLTFTYSQHDVYRTLGPAPSGENTKRQQYEYDALGRLTSVCEITSTTGSGTCGQTNSATGYWTEYTYNLLNQLTGVTQNAQSASQKQTRTYAYDFLGRMTSETNPETGNLSYTYTFDADSTCGTSTGDLVKKVDAIGNVICYTYDALHRVKSSFVPSGLYASSTPYKYFTYDSATVNGVAMAIVKGRLAEAYTCASPSCSPKLTDIGFSYSARGEVSDVYASTPHSGGYYHVNQTYWANHASEGLSATYGCSTCSITGLPAITYGVDGEGRAYSASASSGQNPLSSTMYSTASLPTTVNLGSSDSDGFTYDPNSNRMTQYEFNVNGQSVTGALTWNAIGTLKSLAITDPFYGPGNQTCSYTHEDMGRVASANCGSLWSQTFSYDAFGNINKSGTISFQATYSYLTNQMTQIGTSTPSYDADGNVTNDFLHSYSWDANGRPVTVDGVNLTYDALGRMAEQDNGGVYYEIVYSPIGAKFMILEQASLQKAFVPLPGGSMAVYTSSGLEYYRHSDWIGSSRFASTPTRALHYDGAYAPFGEAYAQSGTTDLSFTGMNQDTVANLYDFAAREYGIQGRWPSPDPAGLWSVQLFDPQSLNRYAYVRNSPLELIDPSGFDDDGSDDDEQCDNGVCQSPTTCDATGCSNTQTVTVLPSPNDPDSNPCYTSDEACNYQLQQILCACAANNSGFWNAVGTFAADALGLVAAVSRSPRLGYASSLLSFAVDPTPKNVMLNVGSNLIPLVVEGADFPIAVGFAAYDGSQFVGNQVVTPVFTPDALQSNTIAANGYLMPNPQAIFDSGQFVP
jgi:RHS repeat-associated protein